MPGLFVALHKEPESQTKVKRLLQGKEEQAGLRVGCYDFPEVTIAQIVRSELGHTYDEHPAGILTWVYGAVFCRHDAPSTQGAARLVSELYLKFGDDFVQHLNGEFNLIIYDRRQQRILLANDRYAIRPWYWTQNSKGFYLSPGLTDLLPLLDEPARIDEEIMVGFLAFNKMRLGDRTMIQQISVLPSAALWTSDLPSGRLQRSTYWQFRYNDAISDQVYSSERVAAIVDCYRAVMNQRARTWPEARVGISLSGGLDSRTMVAALDEELKARVSAHSYGLPDSDEVKLAVEVAKAAGVQSFVYPLEAQDYVNHAEAMLEIADELDIFVQAAQVKFLRQAEERIDVLMTGIDLDVTLGGIYLEPEIMAANSVEEIFAIIKRKNAVFTESELQALLTPSQWKRSAASTYELAYQLLQGLPQEHPAAKYDLFINQFSMRRIIMLRYAQIRSYLETASPMYDYEFIDLVRALPLNERAKHASFIPFLEALSPSLSQITYQRTMLPANAPRQFWKLSEEIERQREQLYLTIWRETNGKVFIPYRRYYTNYDEWLRMEPSWLDLTDHLLGAPQAKLYQMEIAHPTPVAEMIRQHRSGERSHRQRLIVLMSLEMFLRKHFS